MTDEVSNPILERLRRMDQKIDDLRGDMQGVTTRLTALDENMGGLFVAMSGVHSRLDRFDERLSRVERRLDLTDHR